MANAGNTHFTWANHSHAMDLARLAKALVRATRQAIAEQALSKDHEARFVRRSAASTPQSPGLSLTPVLGKLLRDSDFRRMCQEGAFISGLDAVGKKGDLIAGGCLVKDSEDKLRDAIAELRSIISESFLAEGVPITAPRAPDVSIPAEQVQQWMSDMATGATEGTIRLSQYGFQYDSEASIRKVRFRDAPIKHADGWSPVGVYITATETSHSRNVVLDRLDAALARYYETRDLPEDEEDQEEFREGLQARIAAWRASANEPGTDMAVFVSFLQKDILQRVRLAVIMMVMEHLSAEDINSTPAFACYAGRLASVFQRLVDSPTPEQVSINLEACLGAGAHFDVLDVVCRTDFWHRLPIMAKWEFPAFEDADNAEIDRREISYAFKVNGNAFIADENGNTKTLSSYELQVTAAIRTLNDPRCSPKAVQEAFVLLLILDVLLPRPDSRGDDPLISMRERAAELSAMSRSAIGDFFKAQLLGLRSSTAMKSIVEGAIKASWHAASPGARGMGVSPERSQAFQVIVMDGMIDHNANSSRRPHPLNTLNNKERDDGTASRVDWLKMVRVFRTQDGGVAQPIGRRGLMMLKVDVGMRMRVAYAGNANGLKVRRAFDQGPVLNVAFMPRKSGARHEMERSAVEMIKSHRQGRAGFTLTYGEHDLSRLEGGSEETEAQSYAARSAAATMLTQIVMELLLDGIEGSQRGNARKVQSPLVQMLRLQFRGKKEDVPPGTGEHTVYAMSQAVEHALSRRGPTKLQGMAMAKDQGAANFKVRQGKTYLGLLSAFGIDTHSSVAKGTKVGFVYFASRPIDTPGWRMDSTTTHSVVGRAYMAEFDGVIMRLRRMNGTSKVHKGHVAAGLSDGVGDMMESLAAAGCGQIAIVSRAMGGLVLEKTGRGQGHDNRQFLHDLSERHPGVTFYHLSCGTQRVVRAPSGSAANACYEARGLEAHFNTRESELRVGPVFEGGLRPLYSFGTMKVVGERQQSSFMTYHLVQLGEGVSDTPGALRARSVLARGPDQDALLDTLRGIHFLEYEGGFPDKKAMPILDTMSWMQPVETAGAGEVTFREASSRRSRVTARISLTAVAAHVASYMDGLRSLSNSAGFTDAERAAEDVSKDGAAA